MKTSPRDNHEMIEAHALGADDGAEPMRVNPAQLMTVVRQRIKEITVDIEAALKALSFTGLVGRQVVPTTCRVCSAVQCGFGGPSS